MEKDILLDHFKNEMQHSIMLILIVVYQMILNVYIDGRSELFVTFGYFFLPVIGVIALADIIIRTLLYFHATENDLMDYQKLFTEITTFNWLAVIASLFVAIADFYNGFTENRWFYISSIFFLLLFYTEAVKIKLSKEYKRCKGSKLMN